MIPRDATHQITRLRRMQSSAQSGVIPGHEIIPRPWLFHKNANASGEEVVRVESIGPKR